MNNNSYPGILADYGANLSQLVASLTIDEIHQLLGYKVEPELAKKAEGPIADILHVVQRPAVKERQNSIGEYIENCLLKPRPLAESYDQGFLPAITLLANRPLKVEPIPSVVMLAGQRLVTVEKQDEQTVIVPSDGAGRLTGFEGRDVLYNKSGADSETRRLLIALKGLRIPTLILFPKTGELTVKHMQQALYDMNVLAKPLTATEALNRDNRSPYNRIVKDIVVKAPNLPQRLAADTKVIVRFVKIALEGAKAAEKAGVKSQASVQFPETEVAADLAFFWSVFIDNLAPGTLDVADNMATGASGIAALALLAHELFYGRAAQWERGEKAAAITKVAAIGWLRTAVDPDGNVVLNERWEKIGVALTLKLDKKSGKHKGVLGGAGANNQRSLTAHLFQVAGLDKCADEVVTVTPVSSIPAESLPA